MLLPVGEREGQGCEHGFDEMPITRARRSRLTLHARAHQKQCKLSSEQFIIGQAEASRGQWNDIGERWRAMKRAQGRGEVWPVLALQQSGVDPLGKIGQPLKGGLGGFDQTARVQASRQAINRLEFRLLGESYCIKHALGMHHLPVAVP